MKQEYLYVNELTIIVRLLLHKNGFLDGITSVVVRFFFGYHDARLLFRVQRST
jgi:hypothetical protein